MRATSRRRTTPKEGWPGPRSRVTALLVPMGAVGPFPPVVAPVVEAAPAPPVAAPPVLPPPPVVAPPPEVAPPPVLAPPPVAAPPVVVLDADWLVVVSEPVVDVLVVPSLVVPSDELAADAAAKKFGKPKLPWGGAMAVRKNGGKALMLTLTMMSPNCSGVLSRPKVSMGSSKAWPASVGGAPIQPAGASRFWLRIALATSTAVMLQAAILCGSSQQRML